MTGAIIRQNGEGERFWFYGGGVFTVKTTAEESHGSLFMFEDDMVKGKVTPLHIHPDEEETIYVLEGELLVHSDGENHPLQAGGVVMAPRGVPHAFMVTSDTARILTILVPGRAEAFYRGASEPATAEVVASGAVDFDRVRQSGETNGGLKILGPPPFEMAEQSASVS
jgi:quercetin dioxygenase-like cupin family protein